MQKSNLAERNLNSQYVQNNARTYNWPYSQPRLVNAVHATSRTGLLLGILSCLFMLNDKYLNNGFFLIDLFLVLGFFILRCGIVPMVRRATIKEVASESRKLNKIGLIFLCTLMYSGIVRFLGAATLYLINNSWDFRNLVILLINSATIPTLIIGAILVVLPSLLLVFPKDIAIKEYHYKVKNMATQIPDIPESCNQQQYIPANKRMPNMASASYAGGSYKQYNGFPGTTQVDSQRMPKNNTNKNNKKKDSQQKKHNVSVWDADKSIRKPRK